MANYVRHGMCKTSAYKAWVQIKSRCDRENDMNYPHYGAKGITYDPNWTTFVGFWEDMKKGWQEGYILVRLDTSKNYTKSNCKWQPKSEYPAGSVILEYNGVVQTMSEWCEELGLKRTTLSSRLKNGWTVEEALMTVTGARTRWKK